MVAEFGPIWSVELHDDAPGGTTIVIQLADPDDPSDLTLFVHAVGAMFHLDELCADRFRRLGGHPAWADLLHAVRVRLLGATPTPPTRH